MIVGKWRILHIKEYDGALDMLGPAGIEFYESGQSGRFNFLRMETSMRVNRVDNRGRTHFLFEGTDDGAKDIHGKGWAKVMAGHELRVALQFSNGDACAFFAAPSDATDI